MRALQNCARRSQSLQFPDRTVCGAARRWRALRRLGGGKAVAADDFPSSRWSEHVSVTGKVKFFNETKGYLALEPGNLRHLYQASYLFGVAGIGLRLPASAVAQNERGEVWDVVPNSPIEGGHYVSPVGRRAAGLVVVTWGAIQVMTEAFLQAYCDEAIACVSRECLIDQKSPEGFSYADLMSDLDALA
jgi:hypothetical protein